MKKLLLSMFLVAALAAPALAAVQNIKVSGDVDSTYIYRDRFNLGQDGMATYNQNFFITQTRLRVDADLSDNVGATIALINERVWGEEYSNPSAFDGDEDIDINLAFVQLREFLYSPLSVTIGRQSLNYGNALVIGAGGPNNSTSNGGLNSAAEDLTKRMAYDGVKLSFDYNPLVVDVFASKIHANNVLGVGRQDDDLDLFGVNANYQLGDEMGTTVEAYLFGKLDRTLNTVTGAKTDSVYVPGLRASTNPIKGLNLQGEVALQRGNDATTHSSGSARADNFRRDALAAQAIVNYALPLEQSAQWNPVLTGVYTYLSGDSNPLDARYSGEATRNTSQAWDPMFEDQSAGTIYNTLFNYSNAHIVTLAAQVNPIEDVTTKLTYTSLWTAKEADFSAGNGTWTSGLMQPDGTTASPRVTTNRELGHEIDADLIYAYTEDVELGLSLGIFVPGDFFDGANNETAKQALANVGVAF